MRRGEGKTAFVIPTLRLVPPVVSMQTVIQKFEVYVNNHVTADFYHAQKLSVGGHV